MRRILILLLPTAITLAIVAVPAWRRGVTALWESVVDSSPWTPDTGSGAARAPVRAADAGTADRAATRSRQPTATAASPPAPGQPPRWFRRLVARALASTPTTPAMVAVVVPRRQVAVSPRAPGVLRELTVALGDRVSAGQVLARIDDRAMRAELEGALSALRAACAEKRKASVDLRQARKRARTRRTLVEAGAMAREEAEDAAFQVQRAREVLDAAEAAIERSEAQIAQLERDVAAATLTAPFDGSVSVRHRAIGALITANEPVVTVVSRDGIVRFATPENRSDDIVVGASITFRASSGLWSGRIAKVAPDLDRAAQMRFVEAELDRTASPPPLRTVGRVEVATRVGVATAAR